LLSDWLLPPDEPEFEPEFDPEFDPELLPDPCEASAGETPTAIVTRARHRVEKRAVRVMRNNVSFVDSRV
jgi:hypothetical protein